MNEISFSYEVGTKARFEKEAKGNRPFPSYLKPLFQSEAWCTTIHIKNEFKLHVNEISCSYERMSTKTRFEKEAIGNSEMAHCQ